MSRIVDIEPLLKKYDGMNEGTEFSSIHFINDLMALEQQPCEEDFIQHKKEVLERIDRREREIDKYIKELEELKQQPCEDCISRKAVKEILMKHEEFYDDRCETYIPDVTEVESAIEDLPSVTPRTNIAETSQDCINRQAVINHICEDKECYTEECKGRTLKRCPDLQWVLDLPSVTPQASEEDIHREREQAYMLGYEDASKKFRTEPQRPKGKWIEIEIDAGEFIYKCSKCGMRVVNPYKYCPNCGEKKEEE